jgi:hypothetical protein
LMRMRKNFNHLTPALSHQREREQAGGSDSRYLRLALPQNLMLVLVFGNIECWATLLIRGFGNIECWATYWYYIIYVCFAQEAFLSVLL